MFLLLQIKKSTSLPIFGSFKAANMNRLIYLLPILLLLNACSGESDGGSATSNKTQNDKFERLKESVEGDLTCAYEMKKIVSAPSGFMLTSGYRACQEEIISNEVIAFEKSEGLGDKLSNVYVSEDLRPINVKFEGGKLIISHYFDSIPLLKETNIYGTEIVYQTSEQ